MEAGPARSRCWGGTLGAAVDTLSLGRAPHWGLEPLSPSASIPAAQLNSGEGHFSAHFNAKKATAYLF